MLKNLKGVKVMKKEELKLIQAGTAPDCEEGLIWKDGFCGSATGDAIGDGDSATSNASGCNVY